MRRRSERARQPFRAQRWLAIVAGSFVLACGCLALLVGMLVRSWTSALDDRRLARAALAEVGDLKLALSDQETGVRGYLLSGEPQFLDPYRSGAAREQSAYRTLDAHTGRLDGLQDGLDQVKLLANRWRTEAAEPEIATRRAGGSIDQSLVDQGKAQFDQIRHQLDALSTDLSALARHRDATTTHLQRLVVGTLIGSLVTALLGALVVVELFRRWITAPLIEIGQAAQSVSAGHPQAFGRYRARELDDVASAVDRLQRSLSSERDRAVRAFETLQQSAVLALHVRSELAADQRLDLADGWHTFARLVPAEGMVAGDCYDVGLVNPAVAYVVVIDVTGHGAVAALNALKAKSVLRTALKAGQAPGDAIGWLKRHGSEDDQLDYLTCFAASIDLDTGRCRYANAGHPPALLLHPGGALSELMCTGPLVGPFDARWDTEAIQIEEGDTLVIATDGLAEAADADRVRIGEAAVAERLVATAGRGPQAALDALFGLLAEHHIGSPSDDVTVLAIGRRA